MLKKIGNIGVDINYSEEDKRYVIITNYCLFIGILGILTYGILDFFVNPNILIPVFSKSLVFVLFFICGLIFNSLKKHEFAKHCLGIGSVSIIFYVTGYEYGKHSHMHLFFVLFGLMPVLLWSLKQWYYIVLYLLVNVLCFFYVEFLMPQALIHTHFPENGEFIFALTTMGFTFFTVMGMILLFKKLLENKEEQVLSHIAIIENKSNEVANLNKDLSKQKNELIELNATKDRFFNIIAHDLKNPFNAILGLSKLLKDNAEQFDSEQIKEVSSAMNHASKNAYDLLINLLDWARIQKGTIQFTPVEIELNELATEVFSLLEHHARLKEITFDNFISHGMTTFADRNMVSTILRNLISNAIKFTPSNGNITVFATNKSDKIIVSVKDSGIGISKSDIDKLFKLDSNFSNKGTNDESGTGLGLILCKEFIALHNESIWVESEENIGSIFSFSLKQK